MIGILAILVGLVGIGIIAAPQAAASGQFTYIVQANGPISAASFFDGMNDLKSVTDLPSSWSQTFASEATYQMTSITAQTEGTQITCQLIKDGEVVDRQTTVGRFTV